MNAGLPKPNVRITVAICTHCKNTANLVETLSALRAQTRPPEEWDLVIIDNASNPPLEGRVDLSWHPSARVVVEKNLGIGRARIRAMQEFLSGSNETLLFLDDDNLPARDYLQVGMEVSAKDNALGCWGGQLLPRFGGRAPDWIEPFLKSLAVFPLEKEFRIAAFTGNYDAVPPTAGMWLRRDVAQQYLNSVTAEPLRMMLGGNGQVRIGAEDMDIALGALDLGYSIGRLPSLVITHIIPAERLTEKYIANLIRGIRAGVVILEAIRFGRSSSRSWSAVMLDRLRASRLPPRQRAFFNAELDGEALARRLLRTRRPGQLSATPCDPLTVSTPMAASKSP